MNQIDKLKAEIAELENSVDSTMSKEVMYDVLVQAFFKAKDIIELYKDVNPVEQDCPEDVSTELAVVKVEMATYVDKVNDLQQRYNAIGEERDHLDKVLQNIYQLSKTS